MTGRVISGDVQNGMFAFKAAEVTRVFISLLSNYEHVETCSVGALSARARIMRGHTHTHTHTRLYLVLAKVALSHLAVMRDVTRTLLLYRVAHFVFLPTNPVTSSRRQTESEALVVCVLPRVKRQADKNQSASNPVR